MVELCDANAPQKMEEFKGLYQRKREKTELANGRMARAVTYSEGDESKAIFGLSANLEKAANWETDGDCRG
jgi:hypothetical protein